jgi:hypothetical protein
MPDKTNEKDDALLVSVSKKIGKAVGKIARTTGLERPPKKSVGKLARKKKARLPRRQKKATRKHAA